MRPWSTRRVARLSFRIALALSPLIWLTVFAGRFHVAPEGLPGELDYRAYFQELNWWPFPLFVIAIWRLVDRSWNPFIKAWLKSWEIVRGSGGARVSPDERQLLVDEMRSLRKYLLLAAWISALVWGAMALRPLWTLYTTDSASEQIRLAVTIEPHWAAQFVFAADQAAGYPRTRLALNASTGDELAELAGQPAYRPTGVQVSITLFSKLQLLFVVAMAFFALYQVLAHFAFFRYLDRLPRARRSDITLWLKHDDVLGEFGLHEFNRALGSLYSAIALCLLIPLVYRVGQGAESGLELAGNILLASIPLAPFILSMLARQRWIRASRDRASRDPPDGAQRFAGQRLWPISLHRPRFAGLSLALALTGCLVGLQLLDYLR